MAENPKISQIQLPNGSTYDIEDAVARQMQLSSTYTEASLNLALEFAIPEDSDNEEF